VTQVLFATYVGLMACLVVGIALRYLPRGPGLTIAVGLPVWLAYVAVLSWFGIFTTIPGRPPAILLIFVPVILFVALGVVRSPWGRIAALNVPLPILLGLQSFRMGVELFLHRFWIDGLAPKMLTYEGANIDIMIGASAPIMTWVATRGRVGLQAALIWNMLGLLALANIITRSILTAPGPLNLLASDTPNTFIGVFPYSLLPGFFPPLAITLHILAIRAIRIRLQQNAADPARSSSKTVA
jgi:hypothetical protein